MPLAGRYLYLATGDPKYQDACQQAVSSRFFRLQLHDSRSGAVATEPSLHRNRRSSSHDSTTWPIAWSVLCDEIHNFRSSLRAAGPSIYVRHKFQSLDIERRALPAASLAPAPGLALAFPITLAPEPPNPNFRLQGGDDFRVVFFRILP